MGMLGDHFPRSIRKERLTAQLTPGTILHLFCPFTDPQKNKYVILAHVGSETLCFIINSEINSYLKNRPWLAKCQIELKVTKKQYSFLKHNSIASCHEVIDHFSFEDIYNQVKDDLSLIKGELNQKSIKDILNVVNKTKTISKAHKDLIISSLSRKLK